MTKIKRYVECIDEELADAKDYAEKYIECKAMDNMSKANKYKEMAFDELKHANYIHDFAVGDIELIAKINPPTVEMEDAWNHSHKEYVERTAWIRQMLQM